MPMKNKEFDYSKYCIGIVTPSSPAPALFPERYKRGLKSLTNLGFSIKEGSFSNSREGIVSASAKDRANDINKLFADSEISLILATIGGNFAAEILQFIDWNIIKENKKGLIGYSDITVLLIAIGLLGKQVVYYGPTLMTEFSEYPAPPQDSIEPFLKLFKEEQIIIEPYPTLFSDGSDWGLPSVKRDLNCPVISKTIRAGIAEGVVIGGCIESLDRLRGTKFWPCFDNSILILETSKNEFNEIDWRSLLVDYQNMGILEKVSGIIIGQKKWNEDQVKRLSDMFLSFTQDKPIPILYGLPFGHISPIATLPLFTSAKLDTTNKILEYKDTLTYDYSGNVK